jgi:hypothetical protein
MSFIFVEAVARLTYPFYIRLYISVGLLTAHSDNPSTKTPRRFSSRIYRNPRSDFNKSLMNSL